LAWEPLLAEARSRAAEPELEPELPPVSAGRFRDKSKEAGSQDELDSSGKRIGRKSKRSSTDDAAPSLSNPLGKSKDKGKAADPEASSEAAPSGRKKDRKSRGGGDAETPAGGFLFQQTRADEAVEDALVEVSKASGDALASEGKKHKKKHKKGLAGLIQTVGDAVRGDLAAVGLVGAEKEEFDAGYEVGKSAGLEHNAVADVSLLEDSVQAAMSMQKTYLESPSGTEAYSVMLAQKAGESGLAQKDGESGLYYSTDAVEKAKSEEQAGGGAGEPAAQAEIDDPLVSMVSPADQTDGGAEARVEDGLKAGLLRAEGEAKVEYPPLTEEFPPLTEEEAPLTEEEGDAGGAEVRVEEGLKAGLEAAADQTKEDEHMEELEHVEKGILLALLVACGAAALLVLAALVSLCIRGPTVDKDDAKKREQDPLEVVKSRLMRLNQKKDKLMSNYA